MELGIYQLLEKTLQVYSVLVLAWIGSLVADLIINKPLGLRALFHLRVGEYFHAAK
jgi:hypothetical protein